ncbi:MAG: NUDIX domain-containing protein [Gammaproteobacteria bacterium]|nr:NUDIX domain-containing protein [Gammaproteobacteria bacterium]
MPWQAAHREVIEEIGLQLRDMRLVGITSNIFSSHNHSISPYSEAKCVDWGSLIAAEREKCRDWEYRQWAEVNNNLFYRCVCLSKRNIGHFHGVANKPTS